MGFVPSFIEVAAPNANPRRAALVVHGILGSGANWRSFVRRLVETDPGAAELRWILVDLRNHGDSVGALPPHTVAACAEDLRALEGALGLDFELTLGHSFGGKVVLTHAGLRGSGHGPRGVWFLDTPLGAEVTIDGRRSRGDDEVGRVLGILHELAEPLPSRPEIQAYLRGAGLSVGLAQWMTTNVRGNADQGYHWRFDLAGCEALIADYFRLDLWSLAASLAQTRLLRCVVGGRSDRFQPEDRVRLGTMAGLEVQVLEQAGHWLHVDDPDGLRALFSRAVRELSP